MNFLEVSFDHLMIYFFFFFISPPILIVSGLLLRSNHKKIAKKCFILAFLIPLISFGLCLAIE